MFKRTIALIALLAVPMAANAQDSLPADNGLADYHVEYRESESHPLRIVGYVLHPIGWVFREVIFRPLSHFASSTEVTRSVMGYRHPHDYRQPECFSNDDSAPDCHAVAPFKDSASGTVSEDAGAAAGTSTDEAAGLAGSRQVYFPDVNFDFNKRTLNQLGTGRVSQIAKGLKEGGPVKVVLEGHTDYIGTDAYNQKLGMDRAEAVKAELVRQGIAQDRLGTVTFGESQPVFTQQEDWARAVNRRVEVHADENAAQPAAPAAEADGVVLE